MPATSQSIWVETAPPTEGEFPPLTGDISVDVAVVGAGITGLTTALQLKRAGLRVAVLERDRVAMGESGWTTAHATAMLDASLAKLIADHGEDKARIAVQSNVAAIRHIEVQAQALAPDCNFERVAGYLMAGRAEHLPRLRETYAAAQELGLQVAWLDTVPPPFDGRAAIHVADQARFHPRRYLLALAKAIHGDGSIVAEHTTAQDVDHGSAPGVRTDRGRVVAQHVILATGIPFGVHVGLDSKVVPYRTFVAGAWSDHDLPGMYWDLEDPYHYTRAQPVDGRYFVFAGGEDRHVGAGGEEDAAHAMEVWFRENLGMEPEMRWSGQILETVDGLPYVGRMPGQPRILIATGYGGNGMTYGTMAGLLLSDLVLGRETAWAPVFDPGRMALSGAGSMLGRAGSFVGTLVKDRMGGAERRSVATIGPGKGAVIRGEGGEKLAVYRDPDGVLHAVSAVCTHARCDVRFNDAEATWDCPCHGSRFDTRGQVLNGPAVKPLEPREVPRDEETVEADVDAGT